MIQIVRVRFLCVPVTLRHCSQRRSSVCRAGVGFTFAGTGCRAGILMLGEHTRHPFPICCQTPNCQNALKCAAGLGSVRTNVSWCLAVWTSAVARLFHSAQKMGTSSTVQSCRRTTVLAHPISRRRCVPAGTDARRERAQPNRHSPRFDRDGSLAVKHLIRATAGWTAGRR
jgi:hypothetical protein